MRKFERRVVSHRRVYLVALVDVVAQRIGVVELLVTLSTRVVVEHNVLRHANCAVEETETVIARARRWP
ncbi:hypothetical protein ACFQJ8_22235 [Halocatena marina]|uniref:hypothetical protein n=1 Tax=Halocatena marina TaxID=2934937 RepID=UPI0036241033